MRAVKTRPHRFRCLRRHVPRRRPCAAGRHDDAAAHVVDLHAGGAELPAFHSAAAYTQRCQAQHLGRRTHVAEQATAAVQLNTEKKHENVVISCVWARYVGPEWPPGPSASPQSGPVHQGSPGTPHSTCSKLRRTHLCIPSPPAQFEQVCVSQ